MNAMAATDHYQTLGVAHDATQDVVKRAYRKLARRYHPDVSKEANAEQRFKAVAEAHEALIDSDRRAAYDESLHEAAQAQAQANARAQSRGPTTRGTRNPQPHDGAEHMGEGWHDDRADGAFFDALFSRYRAHEPAPQAGADHHAFIEIDLLDAYTGARRVLSVREEAANTQSEGVMQSRQIEVSIPNGIRQGQKLRLSGQGGAGSHGLPRGDLLLEVRWRPDAIFRVEGSDVYLSLPITPWEAALGGHVRAPTPDGTVDVSIPPGSSAGRKLRLKGKGVPGVSGHAHGDLLAVLSIAVPPAHSTAEREAYAALAQACASFNPREAWTGLLKPTSPASPAPSATAAAAPASA
jgi:curved DNA-binding protein